MNRSPFVVIVILFLMSPAAAIEQPPPPPQPIRVGVLHSLTGPMAISERSLVDAISMAISEVNARGGVLGRPLEAVTEDGESDGPTFALKAEKLIVEDKVDCIFGCWTSASRQAVLPVVEKYNNLLWYPVQYEGQETSPNIIYTGATPNQQILPALEWCRREFGSRIFLAGSDYVFPRTANEIIRQRLADYGVIPLGEEYQPLDSLNFDDVVAKIVMSKPDVVLSTINGVSNRAFFKSLRQAGIDQKKIPVVSFSIAEHEILDIGVELTAGNYCSWTYFQSIDTPANRRFVRKFKERFGEERVTDDPVEAAYTQVHLYAKSVQTAGSTDIDFVRQAVKGLIFSAPGGLIRIDPGNQHTWKVAHVGKIKPDGQFTIVWSSEDPLPPRPFLPATFLNRAEEPGADMFSSISRIIELEAAESAVENRKSLLLEMANVRGYMAEACMRFRKAGSVIQPANWSHFEQGWEEFDRHLAALAERRDELTDAQRELFKEFNLARIAYDNNAKAMFSAIYPDAKASSGVTP